MNKYINFFCFSLFIFFCVLSFIATIAFHPRQDHFDQLRGRHDGQPGAVQLRRREGRHRGLHQVPRPGAGQPQHHRELRGPWCATDLSSTAKSVAALFFLSFFESDSFVEEGFAIFQRPSARGGFLAGIHVRIPPIKTHFHIRSKPYIYIYCPNGGGENRE